MAEIEIPLSKGFVPPAPPEATKLVVRRVALRIDTALLDQNGVEVPGSAYTSDIETTDPTIRNAALAAAQAANPTKVPS